MSKPETLQPLSESQMEFLEEATEKYMKGATPIVGRYLAARGIDPDTAATNRLGVVTDPLPGHTKFEGFLSIPYLDRLGRPLTLRFRCMQEHNHRDFGHGKYMSLPHDPARTYNVRAIFEAKTEIHVTEGELDAVILNKLGLPAIAIPGAQGWRNHHRRMLAGFSRVFVWGDPDDAGAEFTAKVTSALRTAKGVRLYDGDVTDTYIKNGGDTGGADAVLALVTRKEIAA